jgi:CrtC N-terminal lipocalin domain
MMDNAASVIENYLLAVQARVNQIIDPDTKKPVQIPDFEKLMTAARGIDKAQNPALCMAIINNLLGRASNFDFAVPGSAVSFPADHHLHPTMGPEWYWFGCHLQVIDQSTGKSGRLSVFADMQRTRCVGLNEQRKAGWTDEQVTLACSLATATVDMGPGQRTYVRRSNNTQWPLKGGSVQFSKLGEPFSFKCGEDSLTGSRDVLPLTLTIHDGANLDIALVFACNPQTNISDPEKAFFLQGVPIPLGNGGTGLTPLPTPGIYYSWPQLAVTGTVTVRGATYAVQSGNGWIDHQLMMKSLENPAGPSGNVHPVPFVEDARPFDGWLWQYFNFDDLTALTGAAFINGEMNAHPPMTYGYYLQPNGSNGWNAVFVNGTIDSLWPNVFPVPCAANPPFAEVTIPIVRTYRNVLNIFDLGLLFKPVAGVATPWCSDGTFDLPSGELFAEFPADYTDMSGHHPGGVGYLESSGFEPVAKLHAYQLDFLAKHGVA